jgi:hypothetical protein
LCCLKFSIALLIYIEAIEPLSLSLIKDHCINNNITRYSIKSA